MTNTSHDLQIEIDGLRHENKNAKNNVEDFKARHFNTFREDALIYILKRAIELVEGCDLLTEDKLVVPIRSLTRDLLESLFWVRWVTLSKENAQTFVDATGNEMKRLARVNLNTGHAKVYDRATGKDVTKDFLSSEWADNILRRLKIFDIAKDGGLEKLYRQIYGFLSLYTHGITFGLEENSDGGLVDILAVTNVVMGGINLVVRDWIVRRKQTDIVDLYAVLQL